MARHLSFADTNSSPHTLAAHPATKTSSARWNGRERQARYRQPTVLSNDEIRPKKIRVEFRERLRYWHGVVMPAGESDFQWLVIARLAGNLSISLKKLQCFFIKLKSQLTQHLPYLPFPVQKPYKLREVKIGIVVTNLSKYFKFPYDKIFLFSLFIQSQSRGQCLSPSRWRPSALRQCSG